MTLATPLPSWGFSKVFDFWLIGLGENGISWSLNRHLSYKSRWEKAWASSLHTFRCHFCFLFCELSVFRSFLESEEIICHYYDHSLNLSFMTVYGVCNCGFLFNWDLFELSGFSGVKLGKVLFIPTELKIFSIFSMISFSFFTFRHVIHSESVLVRRSDEGIKIHVCSDGY